MPIRRTILLAVIALFALLPTMATGASQTQGVPAGTVSQGKASQKNPHCQSPPVATVSVASATFPSAGRMVLTGTMLDTVTAIRPNPLGALFYNPAGVYGGSNSPSVTIHTWSATTIDVSYDGLDSSTALDVNLYDSGFGLILNFVV